MPFELAGLTGSRVCRVYRVYREASSVALARKRLQADPPGAVLQRSWGRRGPSLLFSGQDPKP